MNNLITAQEAFNAMLAGKQVLARCNVNMYGEKLDEEFLPISGYSADIYAQPDMEYCIKIETVEVAGITFTKPLTMDEVQDGQDIFIMQPHGTIYQYKFNRSISILVESIATGFAQRDFKNAKLQYEAFCKAVGFNPFEATVKIIEQNQKKRPRKSKVELPDTQGEDNFIDELLGPASNVQNSTSNEVEKADSIIEFKPASKPDDYQKNLSDLMDQASKAQSPDEANALVKYTLNWSEEQRLPLVTAISKRLCELQAINKSQPSLMVRIQNAPDLTTLDTLEIDVSALDPVIQPEMMKYVKARRQQLENAVMADQQ